MTIHKVDVLMEQTRQLAAEFYRTTQEALPVTAELAKYDAIRLLDLSMPENPSPGIDAIAKAGSVDAQRLQIKGRVVFNEHKSNYRLGQINTDAQWDGLLLVLYGADYRVTEIYLAGKSTVMAAVTEHVNPKRSKRGAMSIAKFKAISQQIWVAGNTDQQI